MARELGIPCRSYKNCSGEHYAASALGFLIGLGLVIALVSALVLGGLLSQLLGEALARTGVLSGLAISRERVKRI